MSKKEAIKPECRIVEGYNPYEKAIMLTANDGTQKSYLCVNERISWYTKYCEEKGYVTVGIATEFVPELTRQGMITMKATVLVGSSVFTGYGSRIVDSIEGYSGDDIEMAETRAIGRALRNAGFGSPFDDGEDNPVDGFPTQPPQSMRTSYAPMTAEQVIANGVDDTPELPVQAIQPANQPVEAQKTKKPAQSTASANLSADAQLAEMLCKPYPFRPWKDRPVYELLEMPDLKKNLEWISTSYSGSTDIRDWATQLLKYIYPADNTDKEIYLAARKLLIDKKLIK